MSAPALAAHPHYERLMRRGVLALEQGDAPRAKRDLRLACFGMLEEPTELVGCLVHLGLAQTADDDGEGFRGTFDKILEAEDRFGAYAAAPLPPALRTTFEREVLRLVPPATLEMAAPFRELASRARAAQAGGAPATGATGAPPAPAAGPAVVTAPPPSQPPPAAGTPSAPDAATVGGVAGVATDPAGAPAPPPAASALPADEQAKLARARELLAAAARRVDLDEPYRLAREVADARPEATEAQHLAAVIAYRASRWSEAVTYFRRGGDPGDDQPERLFYLAVALFESGQREEAAAVFERSLPRLERTPFVRAYQEKILGGES